MANLSKKGLVFSILKSSEPKVLNLGYRSPYGYAISTLVVEFDYFVRVQKTLARKNLRSDEQVRQAITEMTRFIRRVFNETARFDRWLSNEQIHKLSRNDFVPEADEAATKRVTFASEVFGKVPGDVFSGKLQPRHSRRRLQMTSAERHLLEKVGAELDAPESAPEGEHKADAGLV